MATVKVIVFGFCSSVETCRRLRPDWRSMTENHNKPDNPLTAILSYAKWSKALLATVVPSWKKCLCIKFIMQRSRSSHTLTRLRAQMWRSHWWSVRRTVRRTFRVFYRSRLSAGSVRRTVRPYKHHITVNDYTGPCSRKTPAASKIVYLGY